MFRHVITYIGMVTAALMTAACAKTEVSYDTPSEIALAPVVEGMTKAAVAAGAAPTGQDLVVWANYAEVDANLTTAEEGDSYFENAVFTDSDSDNIWTGRDQVYFWPKSGKITLSGCTELEETQGTVAYDFTNNKITVGNYKQSLNPSETVDFLWFNKTDPTNLDRQTGDLELSLNHALSWVTVKVQGFGGSVGWNIESIILKNVQDAGVLSCTTAGAEWENVTVSSGTNEFVVYQAPETGGEKDYLVLTADPQNIENTPNGTVLIPQTPVQMEIGYHTTPNPSPSTLRSKTLDLKISDDPAMNIWEAGKHYTYSITFNPYKITFSVDTSTSWEEESSDIDKYVDSEINP